ncbi:hypothetical protein N7495_004451 [Penicillium taxi]|uniref:uncharacterized protein n=1 Tax=Penicillium taxi TaxID=168475 RepID=UPI0025452462|nr:uncharacterized protein N7495_004451 [Penicillium taxi]KAJ5899707.1 hypothetical protein N7495_004451 [Penicillium taxi]
MKTCVITFVTGNSNKVVEVNAILGESLTIQACALDIPEIQGAVKEIARDKCRRAAEIVNGPVIVEDCSLELSALNGLPGPYIKSFLALGSDGLNKLLYAYADKGAEAVCTLAFSVGPGAEPLIFQGRLKGNIVPARGPSNFGWQPIFEHNGETLAEMGDEKRNNISDRYQAWAMFRDWFSAGGIYPKET